jgi:small subunit ribosomal protein S4
MKNKCTICRRAGVKLFLKGEKCLSPQCPFLKKPYPPGIKRKRRGRVSALSEYGKELKEKQKLKNWYNLKERQLGNYVREILQRRGKVEDAAQVLIQKLESRLDNVVFRLGFAKSRTQARQFVSHGHFLVNGRRVTIPSYLVKKGDKVSLKPVASKKKIFENLSTLLKKQTPPPWLKLDVGKLMGEVVGEPTLKDSAPPVELSSIFEYYSR